MNIALILAAGEGQRFNSKKPKQFFKVNGLPMIEYSLSIFEENDFVDKIIVVTNPINKKYFSYEKYKKICAIIPGSETRQQSSFEGLKYIKQHYENCALVIIHDADRPLLEEKIVNENIKYAQKYNSAVTVTNCLDSIVLSDDSNFASRYLDRNKVFLVQTPQTFNFSLIYSAYLKNITNLASFTDDSSIFSTISRVKFVKGDAKNFKVTSRDDFKRLKNYFYH